MDDAGNGAEEDAAYDAWSNAIDGALARAMPQANRDWGYGTLVPYRLGGPDPLRYVWTIPRDEPAPHWLYVTKGFSEPDLETAGGELSGYGFELTLRVPRDPASGEEIGPASYATMLQSLARYVFGSGNVFVDGDYMQLDPGETMLGGLLGLGFVRDAEIERLQTPAGEIDFRCIVGLTADELEAVKAWSTYGFVDLAVESGKFSRNRITVPGRASFLRDVSFAARVAEGGAREGSRTGTLYLQSMTIARETRLLRPALTVARFRREELAQVLGVLPNRLNFERALTLYGKNVRFRIEPSSAPALSGTPEDLQLAVTAEAAGACVAAFAGGAKRYAFESVPLVIENAG